MEFILILLFAVSFILWLISTYRYVVKKESAQHMMIASMFMLIIALLSKLR